MVRGGREVLSNVISSQIDIHTLYGGVVPEIASRKHMERINPVIRQALSEAGTTLAEIDATAFIKDGMVDTVSVEDGYLVIEGMSYFDPVSFSAKPDKLEWVEIDGNQIVLCTYKL